MWKLGKKYVKILLFVFLNKLSTQVTLSVIPEVVCCQDFWRQKLFL